MDEHSWNRIQERLDFDKKAGIRSATKRLYALDDEYGATFDDFGLQFWFHKFSFVNNIKTRRKVSKVVDAVGAMERSRKRRRAVERVIDRIFGDDEE